MKNFSKAVIKVYLAGLILLLLFSCTYRAKLLDPYLSLLEEGFSGRTVKGKVFLQGESFFLKNNLNGGAYGDFIVSLDSLYLLLKPPFSSEVLIFWHKGENSLKIVNFDKKKIYQVFLEGIERVDFSQYFLGLKEKRLSVKKGLLEGEYSFLQEEREGEFKSNLFNLRWKIKELQFTSEKPTLPNLEGFKEKEVRIPF